MKLITKQVDFILRSDYLHVTTKWTLQVLEPWKERTQEIQANMLWLVSFQKSIILTYYKVSGIVLLQTERFGVNTRR